MFYVTLLIYVKLKNAALEKELDVSRDTEWQTALPNKESGLQISSAYKVCS